ncbi:Quinone oxidoreductase PIG3 [Vitis vinifera]|uniref:Quinone oxidoreductase PIG3 n=1 Tax=Vitis vinifera TaxID=29760 RepID=A0A438DKA2_VITVI|nr:Quinone oxidoreductase PIG3 [Vitis vinifera]
MLSFCGIQVCALLSGGGYAEKVAVPAGQVLLVPSGVSLKDAAGIPEVHGGSIGIGTFAIQIAKYRGARVLLQQMCASITRLEDFVAWVEETGGKGVDVILDNIGRAYFEGDIDSLNVDGTLFIIGFQGGTVAEVNLSGLLARCLTVQGTTFSIEDFSVVLEFAKQKSGNKAVIVSEAEKNVGLQSLAYKYFPLTEAAEAHQLMESSKHVGKIPGIQLCLGGQCLVSYIITLQTSTNELTLSESLDVRETSASKDKIAIPPKFSLACGHLVFSFIRVFPSTLALGLKANEKPAWIEGVLLELIVV